jgi:hypothetical protein
MDALTIHIFSWLFVKCTLVIYLKFKPITIICLNKLYEGCYVNDEVDFFAWTWNLDDDHCHWLHGLINLLPTNHKAKYLTCIFCYIFELLHL